MMRARAVFNACESFQQLQYVTLEGGGELHSGMHGVKELLFNCCINGGCQYPCWSVGVLSPHSAKHGESGFGKTFTLVVLIMAVRPSAVVASGDGGGGDITGNIIVGGTTICMVGVVAADKSNI